MSSANPIELLNPLKIWKIGHLGHLKELDVSGVANISGDLILTNQLQILGDASFNSNVDISGLAKFFRRPYQEISPDSSYNNVNGYYALAKDTMMKTDEQGSIDLISHSFNLSTTTSSNLTSIVSSLKLDKILAVGYNGYFATSVDGINWDSSGSITTNHLRSVDWSPQLEKFVSVGDDGFYGSTNDGITWDNSGIISGIARLTSVIWIPELGKFLAVGYTSGGEGYYASSVDGVTWSETGNITDAHTLESVIWSAELKRIVAVGKSSIDGGVNYRPYFASSPETLIWDNSGCLLYTSPSPRDS